MQGVNKEYIFEKKEYIEKYLKIIKENKENYNFTIIAYCIMNNHAHFLIYTEDIQDFGNFMHRINLLYAKMYNKEKNRCGVLFRNRYNAEPIYNTKYLINCIKYIHNNPVKANIVQKCEDYKYSSYNDYKSNKGLVKSKIVKEIFGTKCNFTELFNRTIDMRFMDIDNESKEEKDRYILIGIREFEKRYNKKLFDILSNRDILKEIIYFLNSEFKIKYIEIRNFFDIPRGAMDTLKIK